MRAYWNNSDKILNLLFVMYRFDLRFLSGLIFAVTIWMQREWQHNKSESREHAQLSKRVWHCYVKSVRLARVLHREIGYSTQ